jgi:hypothetical protein
MRKKIVAGNWKMNLTFEEGQQLTSEIVQMYKDEAIQEVTVVLNPPFPHLYPVKKLVGDTAGVAVGAQNCSEKAEPSPEKFLPKYWPPSGYPMSSWAIRSAENISRRTMPSLPLRSTKPWPMD